MNPSGSEYYLILVLCGGSTDQIRDIVIACKLNRT